MIQHSCNMAGRWPVTTSRAKAKLDGQAQRTLTGALHLYRGRLIQPSQTGYAND
jgi:hypothetical protein